MPGRGWGDRAAGIVGWGPIVMARRVVDRYGAAGGALLAGGLAYSALFAIVPLTVLLAGIVGLLVSDESRRVAVVAAIGDVLPPMRDLVRVVLDEASGAAGTVSILGAVALTWGASRFVVAFQDAIARVFGVSRRRGVLASNVVAIAAVLGLIGAAVLAAALTGLASFLEAARAAGLPVVVGDVALVAGPPILAIVGIALVYRFVPAIAPGWLAILSPAVVIGIILSVLTQLFVFAAPRLIGAAATIGSLATAFAALAWLGLSFQAVLIGAAWVWERDTGWGGEGGPEPTSAPPQIG